MQKNTIFFHNFNHFFQVLEGYFRDLEKKDFPKRVFYNNEKPAQLFSLELLCLKIFSIKALAGEMKKLQMNVVDLFRETVKRKENGAVAKFFKLLPTVRSIEYEDP